MYISFSLSSFYINQRPGLLRLLSSSLHSTASNQLLLFPFFLSSQLLLLFKKKHKTKFQILISEGEMGVEEEAKKVEVESPSQTVEAEAPPATPPPPLAPLEVSPKDVTEEKTVIPSPTTVEKVGDSKSISVVDKVSSEKSSGGSADRDAVLARVQTEKRMSLIKAWEESEKTQSENKAHKKLSTIISWENTKKATVEAQLKAIEEKLEKKKAEYAEKMKNKIAVIHKEAEEKRAMVEAKRCEEMLKAEEMAAKYRATGLAPKKLFGCFSG